MKQWTVFCFALFITGFFSVNSIAAERVVQNPAGNVFQDKQTKNEMKRGITLLKKGKFKKAESLFRKIIERRPAKVEAHEMLAVTELRLKKESAAEKRARTILKLKPESAKAHFVLMVIEFRKGNKGKAVEHARLAKKYADGPLQQKELNEFISKNHLEIASEARENMGSSEQTGEKPFIAVFPLRDSNTKTERSKVGDSITEMLVTALIRTGRFRILERSQLDKILEEQSLGQSGIIDRQTAVQAGKLAGVDAIVIGSVSWLKSRIELDARIILPASGEAVGAAAAAAEEESELRAKVNTIAAQLAEQSAKVPVTEKRADDK